VHLKKVEELNTPSPALDGLALGSALLKNLGLGGSECATATTEVEHVVRLTIVNTCHVSLVARRSAQPDAKRRQPVHLTTTYHRGRSRSCSNPKFRTVVL
jgi:hypothetical protein